MDFRMHLATFVAFLSASPTVLACSTVAIGKKATADGSVIIAHSDDGNPVEDGRLLHVPAMDHAPGSMRPIYNLNSVSHDDSFPRIVSDARGPEYKPTKLTGPKLTKAIGYIPQVAHTYAYHDSTYGFLNEHNVALAESTASAMFMTCARGGSLGCEPGRTAGEALLNLETLTELAMERAKTAREAVKVIGDLAYEHGFFGSQDPNGSGESLQIADPDEAWTFNILADPTGTKAIWAAVRVPDDEMTTLANMFTIREVNVNDTENCMASPNVYSVAEERGWWKKGEVLDFTRTYSNGEYANKYYSGRRMWGFFRLAKPSLKLDPFYDNLRYDRMWPWSLKPDKPVTPQDVMSWYRDWYGGTQFDMTKGLAAGYGGTPDRFAVPPDQAAKVSGGRGAWERSIALYRTTFCHVQHLRKATPELPREVAGVAYWGAGPAHYTPFIPIPSGLRTSPTPLRTTYVSKYVDGSMNWAIRKVMMTAQTRFSSMHPLVEKKQHEREAAAEEVLKQATEELLKTGDRKAFDDKFINLAEENLKAWYELANDMFWHFSDNNYIPVNQALGYPIAWLQAVGFSQGPPAVPPMTQCPPMCAPAEISLASIGMMQWTGIVALTAFAALTSYYSVAKRYSRAIANTNLPDGFRPLTQ